MDLELIMIWVFAIIGFAVVSYAQTKVSSAYHLYRERESTISLSGQEVARMILDQNGLKDVHVLMTSGELTDHYDPTRKVVRLSKPIFDGTSIASISVAAHECGHAIQDKEGYVFLRFRSLIIPIVNFITYSGYFVTIFSIFAGVMLYLRFGILMLLVSLLFQLVTLPVEFDASKRARIQLEQLHLVEQEERSEVKAMLDAAAMTYVASVINTLLNLLRLLLLASRRDD